MTAWKDQKSCPLKNGKAILLCCWVEMRGRGERGGVVHPSTCSLSRELLKEREFPFGCRRKGWKMLLAGLLQALCLCVDFFLHWQERCSPRELTSCSPLAREQLRSPGHRACRVMALPKAMHWHQVCILPLREKSFSEQAVTR